MEKIHLSLITCGSVSSGKSTTCGNLMYKTGGISDSEMARLKTLAAGTRGAYSMPNGYSFHLDTEKEEREKGMTIQCNSAELFTDKYHYTITDAPGYRDYISNMITGAVTADVALLLVPADKYWISAIAQSCEKTGRPAGGSRVHAELLRSLGLRANQIIVVINKMDRIEWDEAKFEEIKTECQGMLKDVGFRQSNEIPFIPCSSLYGDNLVNKTDKAPWYTGWRANSIEGFTLLDCLNNFIQPPPRHPESPVRFPISQVFNIKGVGQIACGTLEQGTLKSGDVVGIAPSGLRGKTISSIKMHKKMLDKACPGYSVGVCIQGISEDEKLSTGHVIYVQSEGECKPIKSFTAVIQARHLGDNVIRPGYTPVVVCRSAKIACKMTKIVWKQSRGQRIQNPPYLVEKDVALVEFEPTAPLYVEPFEVCADLGRLAVMDHNSLIMVGRVRSTTPAE